MSKRREPARLGDLIPGVVDRLGVSNRLEETRVEELWRSVAGPQVERVTRRVRLQGNRLIVQLESAAWRQALHVQREAWRQRINEAIGEERVAEIVFR